MRLVSSFASSAPRRVLLAMAGTAAFVFASLTFADPTASIVAGGTPIDGAIDTAVQGQVAARNLSTADAHVYREQLQIQYLSLSSAEQQKILAAVRQASGGGRVDVSTLIGAATKTEAQQALADVRAAAAKTPGSGMQPKLGLAGADRIFIGTVGPCRVADSRNGPGQLPPLTARQIYTADSGSGYSWATDQGGTGTSSTGNCVGSAFNLGTLPDAAVAIVTVVNTTSTGALQAWNGGATLNGGAVVVWNAGDRATNTTVIPMDRTVAAYPGSGAKRDIAVYNNSFAPMDYVVDVVGYYIPNTATAPQCTTVSSATTVVAPNVWTAIDASCPAGYSAVGGGFDTIEGTLGYPGVWTTNLPVSSTTWRTWVDNQAGGNRSIFTVVQCCRVPGR